MAHMIEARKKLAESISLVLIEKCSSVVAFVAAALALELELSMDMDIHMDLDAELNLELVQTLSKTCEVVSADGSTPYTRLGGQQTSQLQVSSNDSFASQLKICSMTVRPYNCDRDSNMG